jgi:ketosteroid isomerase-like protein
MRGLLVIGAVGIAVVLFAACGDSGSRSAAEQELQRQADTYAINQIEKKFHEATTTQDIDLMMSLWAPNASMTLGPGETATGTDEIRHAWLTGSLPFQDGTHWISDHPSYNDEITVDGDRGTLHFECHYIDYDTSKLAVATVADMDVARIDGTWLITNMVGGTASMVP